MKTAIVLIALLACCAFAQKNVLPAPEARTADNIYPYIDHSLKDKYWYYLTRACLLYLTSIERGQDYQYLAIYRNIVGTFLAITTWKSQQSHFSVDTLVRLGNGFEEGSGANYKPVALAPLKLRYSLGPKEFIIEVSDSCVKVNGKVIGKAEEVERPKVTEEQLVEQCRGFSTVAHEKFWYYLDGAQVVYSSVGRTNERNYCLVTYLNHAGTFLAIGHVDADEKAHVATFVRLGNGNAKGVLYEPVAFRRIQLPLKSFDWKWYKKFIITNFLTINKR